MEYVQEFFSRNVQKKETRNDGQASKPKNHNNCTHVKHKWSRHYILIIGPVYTTFKNNAMHVFLNNVSFSL